MALNRVTRRQLLVGIGIGLLSLTRLTYAAPYQTPTQNTDIWRAEWRDAKRDRSVPVKIYFPTGKGPFPVIMFSHGLGGTRENYEYVGQHWAQHGYVSVHLQHIGSDDAVWRGGGGMQAMKGAMTPQNVRARALDVSFAIDQLQTLNTDPAWPLHDKLDLTRIGMAGHSFGANTTLVVSGQQMPAVREKMADPRIKCAIAMSAPAPTLNNYDTIYSSIKIPMFHLTGTEDTSPVDRAGTTAADRRLPFDHITGADAYLITFTGGDHMLFSGRRRLATGPVATDDRNHLLIQEATTAFWDAYLKGDPKALTWLRTDFTKELDKNGVFEQKKAP